MCSFNITRVAAVLLLGLVYGFSQPITGTVQDEKTGEKLSGVSITVKGTGSQVLSGADGSFSITQTAGVNDALRAMSPAAWLSADYAITSLDGRVIRSSISYRNIKGYLRVLPGGMYLVRVNGGITLKAMVANGSVNLALPRIDGNGPARGKTTAATVTLQAENMTLDGTYIPEKDSRLLGQTIMIDPNKPVPSTGSATATFNGPSGVYHVTLVCVPEGDGTPTVQLTVGSNTIINEVVPLGASQLTDRKEYTVQSVAVNNGDQIKVTGTSNNLAYARIDKIVFTDGNSAVLEFRKNGYYPKEQPVVFGTTTDLTVTLSPIPDQGTKPGLHNTGPVDRSNMTVKTISSTWVISQNGAVFENIHIKGAGVWIKADNVSFRNFIIDGGNDWFGVRVDNGHRGILLEDGEIHNISGACLKGVGYTARRLHMHDVNGDHTKPEGTGGPTVIEYCFMEKAGRISPDKMSVCWPDPDMQVCPHADGVQIQSKNGAHDVAFRYNNWHMPHQGTPNAVYGYLSNQVIRVEGNATRIVVESNWLNGGSNTLSIKGDVYVRNNRFGRDFMYGILYPTSTFKEWSGNVWDDTGVTVKPTKKGI